MEAQMEKIVALNLFLVAGLFGLFAMGYVHQNVEHELSLIGQISSQPQIQLMASAAHDTPYFGVPQLR